MKNNSFVNNEGKEIHRQECEIFCRVMGYYRPVTNFNPGKKSEFYSRKYFDETKSINSKFINKYL